MEPSYRDCSIRVWSEWVRGVGHQWYGEAHAPKTGFLVWENSRWPYPSRGRLLEDIHFRIDTCTESAAREDEADRYDEGPYPIDGDDLEMSVW
jgi:hypothetical protein